MIFANDLNPECVKWMKTNVERNHVCSHQQCRFLCLAFTFIKVEDRIRVTCGDGAAFIKQVVRESWNDPFCDLGPHKSVNQRVRDARRRTPGSISRPSKGSRRISHFVMNLPDSAITFLGAFRGLFAEIRDDPDFENVYPQNPAVHCYCFTRELEPERAETDIREVSIFSLLLRFKEAITTVCSEFQPRSDIFCQAGRLYTLFDALLPTKTCTVLVSDFPMRLFSNGTTFNVTSIDSVWLFRPPVA